MIILLLLAIAQVIRVNGSDSTAGDDRRRSHSSALYCRGYGMVWLPHSAQHSVQVATTMTIRLGAGGTGGVARWPGLGQPLARLARSRASARQARSKVGRCRLSLPEWARVSGSSTPVTRISASGKRA